MIFDSQNYSPCEVQIIYEGLYNVDEKEHRRLLDKPIDKYHDWRIAKHLLSKYDDKGKLSNINGKHKTVILCTNKEQALYLHDDHKGHQCLAQTPLKNFNDTIIHDYEPNLLLLWQQPSRMPCPCSQISCQS